MKAYMLCGLLAAVLVAQTGADKVFYGKRTVHPKVPTAYIRTYTIAPEGEQAEASRQQAPVAVGIEFSKDMIQDALSQPCVKMSHAGMEMCSTDVSTTFPKVAGVAQPYGWLLLNLQHQGHEPKGVYTSPHFDAHFFFQTEKEVMSQWGKEAFGKCGGMSVAMSAKANKPMPEACWPGGKEGTHKNMNTIVPVQGNHVLNVASPELQPKGEKFTNAFIWGMFDAKLTFMEPMVTIKYMYDMKPGAKDCRPITMPKEFPKAGYYATQYCVTKDAQGNVRFEMNSFKEWAAGCKGPANTGYVSMPERTTIPGCPVPMDPAAPMAPAAKP